MKGIRREIEQLKKSVIRAEGKFSLRSYKDRNNQERPCYILTKRSMKRS